MLRFIRNLLGKNPIVEKIVRDPAISEPVFMMIKAIKSRPQDWRLSLIDKPTADSWRGHLKLSDRKIVKMEVTDRHIGLTYPIMVEVDTHGWLYAGNIYTTSKNPLMVLRVVTYPEWLTHYEMVRLSHVLGPLFADRIQKVAGYKFRERVRREEAEKRHVKEVLRLERERITQLYTEKQ